MRIPRSSTCILNKATYVIRNRRYSTNSPQSLLYSSEKQISHHFVRIPRQGLTITCFREQGKKTGIARRGTSADGAFYRGDTVISCSWMCSFLGVLHPPWHWCRCDNTWTSSVLMHVSQTPENLTHSHTPRRLSVPCSVDKKRHALVICPVYTWRSC